MAIKRKDFQKAAALLHEFLLKLSDTVECAELRDAVNLTLLHMQRYYRVLRVRSHERAGTLTRSLRGLSPMTPFRDTPDRFVWKWVDQSLDQSGLSPLLLAATRGDNLQLVQHLDKDEKCITHVDDMGRNALMYAVHFGHLDTMQNLLEYHIDVNMEAEDGSTAVHRACHDGLPEALRLLMEYGADINAADMLGRTPIHWACASTERDCLQLLLSGGVNVSVRDHEGLTPGMWACCLDHIEHFALLSEVAQDEESLERDDAGRTWMHWAVRRVEPLECLRTLLTVDTASLQDNEGKTVMHVASEQGSLPAVKVILEIGGASTLEHRDHHNRTPLILATMGGHGEIVNLLLAEGADLSSVDELSATAWDYARARQLNYCMLIIASYIRQKSKDEPNSENGLATTDDNLGIHQLQINGDGDKKPVTYSTTPVPPAHPPPQNSTPRTPRVVLRSQPPVPPPRGRTQSAKGVGVRGSAVKRSPSAPIDWEENEDHVDRNDISSAGSSGKRKRSDYEATEEGLSVVSLESADTRKTCSPAADTNCDSIHPHPTPVRQLPAEEPLPADLSEPDAVSISIDGMEVSDFDGDIEVSAGSLKDDNDRPEAPKTARQPDRDEQREPVGEHYEIRRHEVDTTKGNSSSPMYSPAQWYREFIGDPNQEDDNDIETPVTHHQEAVIYPQPAPRSSQTSRDQRVIPPAHLTPLQTPGPVKKKKKRKKNAPRDGKTPDLPPPVNAPTRNYVAPVLPPKAAHERSSAYMSDQQQQQGPWGSAWLQGAGEKSEYGSKQGMMRPRQMHSGRRKTSPSHEHEQQFCLDWKPGERPVHSPPVIPPRAVTPPPPLHRQSSPQHTSAHKPRVTFAADIVNDLEMAAPAARSRLHSRTPPANSIQMAYHREHNRDTPSPKSHLGSGGKRRSSSESRSRGQHRSGHHGNRPPDGDSAAPQWLSRHFNGSLAS